MNKSKQIAGSSINALRSKGNIEQLIELFVEMCFVDVNDVKRISQFKLLGIQIGYTITDIEKVIEMGVSEYKTLLDEINKAFLTTELN